MKTRSELQNFFKSFSIIKIILLGIILRLLVALFFTHQYDAFNILALVKSVADTGDLFEGFLHIGSVQLYGKIYYQIAAWWMQLLSFIHLLDIRYIFDTKAYSPDSIYLQEFPDLGPELYQLATIKLIQFLYDFTLLFALLKTARVLKLGHEKELTLFWALNPMIIHISYVMFQSDLAMISFLMAGVYFTVASLVKKEQKFFTLNKILALAFFALGAVIKQVPLLMAPVALILFPITFWQVIPYGYIFAILYVTFYQSWAADAELIRTFFLTSPESTALFDYGFNGLNVFFVLYLFILGLTVRLKSMIQKNPQLVIYIFTLVLAAIFISEKNSMVFVQFSIWTLPLLALLTIIDKNFGFFLIANILVFYKRIFFDTSLLVGSWSIAFGEPLYRIPVYSEFIEKFIQFDLVTKMVDTLFTVSYILLFTYIIFSVFKKNRFEFRDRYTKYFRINLLYATLFTFLFMIIIGFTELLIMSNNALLTDFEYGNTVDLLLTKKPLLIKIANTSRKNITGLKLKLRSKSQSQPDKTIIEVQDAQSGEILVTKKIYDYFLPRVNEYYNVFLGKSVNRKNMVIKIYKENNTNDVVVQSGVTYAYTRTRKSTFSRYDAFYKKNLLDLTFNEKPIDINLRGSYTFFDAYDNLLYHLAKKPSFYKIYFGFIFLAILLLLLPNSWFKSKK